MSIYKKLWFTRAKVDIGVKIYLLKKKFSLEEIYNFKCEDFFSLGLSVKVFESFNNVKDNVYFEKTIDYLKNENIRFVFITDKEYPRCLREIYKPPIGIFIRGKRIDFNNSLAIVGARRASVYGKEVAKSFGKAISNHNINVVSGLALGIDAYAHIGALEGNGFVVGVIGSGHKHIYPKTNRDLYEKVLEKGCIVSEYFPEDKPLKHRFPERNRIISGMSKGTVVVEAGKRSGSLITANFALEQGREVYAVPGGINCPMSIGCNELIREGAKIVTDINDILEDFCVYESKDLSYKKGLSEKELKIINCLEEGEKSFEDIHSNLNFEVSELLVVLSKLECSSIIKKMCGNVYSIY